MSDFHDAIVDCALVDAGYISNPYTWYSSRLRQYLDRVLVSSCWMDVFPKMQVTHLELTKSDHRGLLVVAETTMERKASSFGFSICGSSTWDFLRCASKLQYPDARVWYGSASAEINSTEALSEGLEQDCLWECG
ncbi:UNVERIFIED_CONTAM: hypothetical protein Slati_1102100 [Sesamum latifolium]|uniref:Uncharacterized protein n=1 Tax=Sesamum latifolium TaxID=2727402 RepID=A0AAW2XAV8_9LAMI